MSAGLRRMGDAALSERLREQAQEEQEQSPLVTFTQLDKCPVAKLLGHDGPYTVEETSFVVRSICRR